ncbi:hypothetical protein MPC4_380015 [Methylocella tundrae]|uniref:Uncharacterized protein n=1 Tax=Methylocella tundrae TaxID=227605 RepID=A0A8B6M8N3_METTU|nr:hypothetical protein MPC4_380015 [Methylocella tundrae]
MIVTPDSIENQAIDDLFLYVIVNVTPSQVVSQFESPMDCEYLGEYPRRRAVQGLRDVHLFKN